MNVVGLGTGAKSMISLWLLYPPSLARCLCLLRLTKKMMNPIVQASRTQPPEMDPAMIGVLALCLDHNIRNKPHQRQHARAVWWNHERGTPERDRHTYPLRAADSEGLLARATCWIGGVAITMVVEGEKTSSLRK